jgi:hypothetical protein
LGFCQQNILAATKNQRTSPVEQKASLQDIRNTAASSSAEKMKTTIVPPSLISGFLGFYSSGRVEEWKVNVIGRSGIATIA